MKSDYDRQLQSLEKDVEVLNEVLGKYHRDEGLVQAEGSGTATREDPSGASEVEEKIKQMKRSVNRKTTELEQARQNVNREADRLNEIIAQNTGLIDQYNESFSEGYRFHQGVYSREGSRETINIYKFEDEHDLKLILAHEAGHALGLPHVENPESVMYPAMRRQNRADLALSDQDQAALRQVCGDELQEADNYQ